MPYIWKVEYSLSSKKQLAENLTIQRKFTKTIMRQYIGYILGFIIFVVGIPMLMWACSDRNVPDIWQWVVGGTFAVAGLALAIWSIVHMKVHGQGNPFDAMGHEIAPRTQHLMTDGPYCYSRNPMLSGTFVYYIGIIAILCSWQAVLIFAVVVIIMMIQVRNEEQRLERDFGDDYRNYKHKVGRFL